MTELSRRRFLQGAALAAGLGAPAARALGQAPAAEPVACGDPAAAPSPATMARRRLAAMDPDCPGAGLIVKPTPADRFNLLGAGSAEMRWDRAGAGADAYLTPVADFYVHNRGCPPAIDTAAWRLTVEGDAVGAARDFTYGELTRLPRERIVRVLDCAANGRAFFADDHYREPPTPFVPAPAGSWRLGAAGAAEWEGVPLGEVLERAGLRRAGRRPLAVEVLVESVERVNGGPVNRVVPIGKAMAADSLLVLTMNGELLPRDHGAPVRALFSGWGGVANVKWVRRIVVSTTPIFTPWNGHHSVLVGPDYQPGWAAFQAEYGTAAAATSHRPWGTQVTVQNVKSAFELAWGARLPRGRQVLRGRSWSGMGAIREVAVSLDRGATWREARLAGPNPPLGWVRWEVEWDAAPGDHHLIARARDTAGRTQVPTLHPDQMPSFNKFGLMFGDRAGAADSHNAVPHPVSVA